MKKTKMIILIAIFLTVMGFLCFAMNTICNPIDISYRFQLDGASRREAADPTVVLFKGEYFLFASKSGGYWYSSDLSDWKYVQTSQIPVEDYAPTAVVIDDCIYFMASNYGKNSSIYKSSDPKSGNWQLVRKDFPYGVTDPALFLDDDDRLYFYWGCSNQLPIYGMELNKNNFEPIGKSNSLIFPKTNLYGWENPGDYNQLTRQAPWLEGSWMNKINGTYYLQYAAPGTEFKSYSDGVYISEKPLGPYKPAAHNPFASKPEGFVCGAGHGSTFADKYGNYWHIGTMTISQKHIFERRLGLFPVFLDKDGILYATTKYGDYPMLIPNKKIEKFNEIFPEWLLLSYHKKATVSSSLESLPAVFMTDENIRTYWAAKTGANNEWAIIDLGGSYDVYALQINFAEHNTKIYGRKENLYHQYIVEFSNDNINWTVLADNSQNKSDNTHNYLQLNENVNCRYLKIRNIKVPDGNFAISDFRVFGKGNGKKPEAVKQFEALRNNADMRSVRLQWSQSPTAIGYNISYGSAKNKLYHNYMVYGDTAVTINSLNVNQNYYFTIEAFNENGIDKNETCYEAIVK